MFLEGRNAYDWCLLGNRSLLGIYFLWHLQVAVIERHPGYTGTYQKKG